MVEASMKNDVGHRKPPIPPFVVGRHPRRFLVGIHPIKRQMDSRLLLREAEENPSPNP